MSVARRFAAALSVVGLGVLAYAVPASATGDENAPLAAGACVDGTKPGAVEGRIEPGTGIAYAQGRGGAALCPGTSVDVVLTAYQVPAGWDGSPFPGGDGEGRAWPQFSTAHSTATLTGGGRLELAVPVPGCGNVQVGLYTGEPVDAVDRAGWADGALLAGWMWSVGGPNGSPPKCGAGPGPLPVPEPPEPGVTPGSPSPTPTTGSPTPTPTAESPTPTPTSGTGSPTPPPATTVPATPTPTPTSAGTTPAAPPAMTPAGPAATPTQAISSPVPVPPTVPELARTGSDATVPLIGLGLGLLVAGIALSLLGRRRGGA